VSHERNTDRVARYTSGRERRFLEANDLVADALVPDSLTVCDLA